MSDDAHDPHGDLASGLVARWNAQDRQGEAALRQPLKGHADQVLLWLAVEIVICPDRYDSAGAQEK